MLKKKLVPGLLALASLTVANGAAAALITPSVSFTQGTVYTTSGIAGLATTGYDMAEMLVKATFADGTTDERTWSAQTQSSGLGGVTGTGWSLSMEGDSNNSPWVFSNTGSSAIVGLFIDLRPASAVFDVVVSPEGSPGSSLGSNIRDSNFSTSLDWMDGPADLLVTGTYSNHLMIGDTFYADLFLTLDLRFSRTNGTNGIAGGEDLFFRSDTDSLATRGDISIPGGTPVPEPGTLALLGLGLLGLNLRRRR